MMELWLGKKFRRARFFIVTHNIEEAVILADVSLCAANPAHIHAEFNVTCRIPGIARMRASRNLWT